MDFPTGQEATDVFGRYQFTLDGAKLFMNPTQYAIKHNCDIFDGMGTQPIYAYFRNLFVDSVYGEYLEFIKLHNISDDNEGVKKYMETINYFLPDEIVYIKSRNYTKHTTLHQVLFHICQNMELN
jgi:hypothetical protein